MVGPDRSRLGANLPDAAPSERAVMGVHHDPFRRNYTVRWTEDGRRRVRPFERHARRGRFRSRRDHSRSRTTELDVAETPPPEIASSIPTGPRATSSPRESVETASARRRGGTVSRRPLPCTPCAIASALLTARPQSDLSTSASSGTALQRPRPERVGVLVFDVRRRKWNTARQMSATISAPHPWPHGA